MLRRATVTVTAIGLALAGAVVAPAEAAPAAAPVAGRFFVAKTPTRVLDTRESQSVPTGGTVNVDLRGKVPTGATAAAVTVTVTDASAATYVSAYATGTTRTVTSVLNTTAGVTTANTVTVPLGTGASAGQATLYLQQGPADLVVDLLGAYAPASSAAPGSSWYPVTPQRLVDTRNSGALAAGRATTVTTSFGSAALNRATKAVAIGLIATEPTGAGYLSAWNGDPATARTTSAVNFGAGQTVSNAAVVPVRCTAGCAAVQFAVQNNISGSTQVVVDLVGRYGTPGAAGGAVYRSLAAPVRLQDEQSNPQFTVDRYDSVELPALTTIDPAATSASINLTVANTVQIYGGAAIFTVWPGAPVARPAVSSVFYPKSSQPNRANGDPKAAGLPVALSAAEKFSVYLTQDLDGPCQIEGCGRVAAVFYVDVQGTFDADPASA